MKNLPLLFARRYLISKKSHSVINIISRVSSVAVGVPVAAMVILLSVFNGFERMVESMYNDFDADLSITAVQGKVFDRNNIDFDKILSTKGVVALSQVLEGDALLEYRGRQYVAVLRGVDSMYHTVVPIDKMVTEGEYNLMLGGEVMQALVGQGVAYSLGVRVALLEKLRVLVPRRGADMGSLLPINSYRTGEIFQSGVFTLDAETDGKYVIVPIEFSRELLDYHDHISSIMIRTERGANVERVRDQVTKEVGAEYKVQTRMQKNAATYRVMKYEKWGIFFISLMVLVIASFSIVGSLAMLIIDKREDRRTIVSMGGRVEFIRKIFVREGMLISSIGAVGGLVVGLGLCWVQSAFGLIKIPADTFLVDSYPVVVKFWDVAIVVVAFIAVSYIITKFTVIRMIPKSDIEV